MGEFYALGCALVWAFAVVFFRRSGESMPPLALNLFRVGLSTALFLVTLLATGRSLLGQAPPVDYALLLGSGVVAIALSDTLFHAALNRVGAGINAVVDTLYSPFTAFGAFVFLGERLDRWQVAGMTLVIGSVIVATRIEPPAGTPRRTLVVGVLLGVASMGSLAAGIVMAKPALDGADVVWATAVRQVGALAVLLPAALLLPGRRRRLAALKPGAGWRFAIPGTVLGSYVALILWIAGMKHTAVGKAAVLNQTSTIYTLVLASLLLGEKFTRRTALAAGLALAGVLLVMRPWAMP
ncbi:MAG: DMT family transporter [bacterium]|nr:DMT family transporter [bacterium]